MQEPQVPLSHIEEMVERKVKRILADMLGLNEQAEPSIKPIAKAFKTLGYESPQGVYKDIRSGLLRVGHEVFDRRRPGSQKPRYVIDIEAAKERLKSDPDRRRVT